VLEDSTDVVEVVDVLVIDSADEVSEDRVDEVEAWDVSEVVREVIDSVVVTDVSSVEDCAEVEVELVALSVVIVEDGIDVVADVKDDSIVDVTMEVDELGISVDVTIEVGDRVGVASVETVEGMVSVEPCGVVEIKTVELSIWRILLA